MESSPAASSTEIMNDDTDNTSSAIAAAATAIAATPTSNTAAAPSSSLSTSSLSLLSEQDQVVYGTLNKELADVLAEQITIAIRNGVDSLPLLDDDCYRKSSNTSSNTSSRTAKQQEKKQDDHQAETNDNDAKTKKTTSDTGTPKQNLCQTLKYKFIRNVDVLESYCAHHLFTLKKHLPARRKRIVSTITSNGLEVLPLSSSTSEQEQQKSNEQEEEEEDDHSPTTTTTTTTSIRSKNELPSSKEVSNLMNEVSTLQKQLELMRKERNELLVLQESTKRAEVYVNEITKTATTTAGDNKEIIQKTEIVVTDGNTIGRLADEAKNMIQKLDTTTTTMKKRGNNEHGKDGEEGDDDDNDEEDDDQFDFEQQDHNNGSNKRLKPLSMKETYEQDKKQLGLSLNDNANANANANDGLNTIKDMLLLSKEESKSK
jgi:hypothetical protein